jgi:hypothetical protein
MKIDFKDSLAFRCPGLLDLWHPTKNKFKPSEIYPYTIKTCHLVCRRNKDHVWKTRVTDAVKTFKKGKKLGPTCMECGIQNVLPGKSLKDKYPKIAEEFHPTKNGYFKPEDFSVSSRKTIWWLCKRNPQHEFQNSVGNRVRFKQKCPHCSGSQTSSIQISLYCEIKKIFKDLKLSDKSMGFEMDMFSPKYKLAVEVDGFRFHEKTFSRDIKKDNLVKQKDINLIRLREKGLKKISKNSISYTDYKIRHYDYYLKLKINEILIKIKKLINNKIIDRKIDSYIKSKNLQNREEYLKINDRLPGPKPGNSLLEKHPNIAKEFHPKKNGIIKPDMISRASDAIVWWLCKKNKKHEWQTSIKSRTKLKDPTGCPYCSGVYADENTNIAKLYPNEVKQIYKDKILNANIIPSKILEGSHLDVWWICTNNKKHLFKREVRGYLVLKQRDCPICKYKNIPPRINYRIL